jgi:hypothetical protein
VDFPLIIIIKTIKWAGTTPNEAEVSSSNPSLTSCVAMSKKKKRQLNGLQIKSLYFKESDPLHFI